MTLSKSEQNHIADANSKLCGKVFSCQSARENGMLEMADITQIVEVSEHRNQTIYPHRKYYNIKVKRSYVKIAPCQTVYSYSVYVDEAEVITEITPLYVVNDTNRHRIRKTATKADYHTAVYRIILGAKTLK